MLLERYPIRALVPLFSSRETLFRRAGAASDTHWPIWWERERSGQVVTSQHCLIAIPHYARLVTTSMGLIVSRTDIVPTALEQEAWSYDVLKGLPCLVHTGTGSLACYAHPLGRGTFYYTQYQGYLLISTSLHDLCRATQTWEPDEEAVADFLFSAALLRTNATKTLISGILQIPPGSMLSCYQGAQHIQSYWQPHKAASVHTLTMHQAIPLMREAIRSGVARAIGSAKTVGIHYSGGLDSSTVAGYALEHQRKRGGDVILIAAGNEVSSQKESVLRRSFVQAHQCGLHEVSIDLTQNIFPILQKANRVAPSPSKGLFATVNETLARQATTLGVEVLLTGEGGEELFGDNDLLLADLLLHGKWIAAYHCLAFLTALSQNRRASLIGSGLLPIATVKPGSMQGKLAQALTAGDRRKLLSQQASLRETLAPLYGEAYAAKVEDYQQREARDLRDHFEQGWALADYQAVLGVWDLPPFEPGFDYQDDFSLSVASPLTDPEVFEVSLSLRLEERLRLGVGFRSKPLLRAAAALVVPSSILLHPKINIADLPWRVLHHHLEEVFSVLHSPVLQRPGITPQVSEQDVVEYPDYGILRLLRLLILAIWLEEGKKDVEATKNAARSTHNG